jgi:DNA-binding transcriptional MerR regulator
MMSWSADSLSIRRVAEVNGDLLTIDELAEQTGLTTRNIRAYQSRGLLPPPEVRGRTGYYAEEHRARLGLIREMQADGFNLTAIKRLIDGSGGEWEDMLGFKRIALSGWETEEPQVTTVEEFAVRFGVTAEDDPEPLRQAIKLGAVVPLGGGRLELPSPSLIKAGEEVVAAGVPLAAVMEVFAKIMRHTDAVAQTFTRLFLDTVLRPFQDRGAPPEEWPQVRESLERLQPVAGMAVSAAFALQITAAAEETYGRVLGGEGFEPGRASRGRDGGSPKSSRPPRSRRHSGRRRRGAGA